jgi:hypothetical protein
MVIGGAHDGVSKKAFASRHPAFALCKSQSRWLVETTVSFLGFVFYYINIFVGDDRICDI